jgi:large subunit ribosomal protein L4
MVKELVEIDVMAGDGKKLESLEWDLSHFDSAKARRLISDVSLLYLSNQKKRTANTKTRSEVLFSGRKPWKQKGTGRARAGSFRSPIWVGGGVAHGPRPRDVYYTIPRKLRRRALKDALLLKIRDRQVLVVERFDVESPKTKEVLKVLKSLSLEAIKVLLVVETYDANLVLSSRNLEKLRTTTVSDLNVLDILSGGRLLFTKAAFQAIQDKILDPCAREDVISVDGAEQENGVLGDIKL